MNLWPYQEEGATWLTTKRGALLADEMRLGKTPQAIVAADMIGARSVLVLCPAVARINWIREFNKFSILSRPAAAIMSSGAPTCPNGVTVCSYDLAVRKDVLPRLLAIRPDVLVCDESHYLKSATTQRTAAVLGKSGLVHTARRFWFLSGTPAPNYPSELWPLLHVLGVYPGKYDSFVRRFCTGFHDGREFKVTGGKNEADLRRLMAPIVLRRRMKDVWKDMPELTFTDVVVEPGEVDHETWFPDWRFNPHRKDDVAKQEAILRAALSGAKGADAFKILEGLAGSTATLRRWTGLAKVEPALELIKAELDAGLDKIVVFAVHRDVIRALIDGLRDYGAVSLFGGTPTAKRQRNIDRFTTLPKYRVFIGNVQAAGTAIDLSVANNVIFVESDWVPGNNAQAAMRVHHKNQTRPVLVRFLSAAGQMDEAITKALNRKARSLMKLFD